MENEITPEEATGLSRRQMLKRGAAVGGALVWTVPAVQSLSAPAFAQVISPGGNGCPAGTTLFSFKIEVNDGVVGLCSGPGPTDVPGGQASQGCTFAGYSSGADGCDKVVPGSATSTGTCLSVTFVDSCDLSTASVKVKSGTLEGFCANDPTVTTNGQTLTVCLGSQNISFVAFQICC